MELQRLFKGLSILVFSLSIQACTAESKIKVADMKDKLKEPVMTIDFKGGGCFYNILVNDIPVYSSSDGGYMASEVPVNPYLINGANTLSIQVKEGPEAEKLAKKGENCQVSATLVLSENNVDQDYQVATLTYSAPADKVTADKNNIQNSTPVSQLVLEDNKLVNAEKQIPDVVTQTPIIKSGTVYYGYNFDDQTRNYQQGVKTSLSFSTDLGLPEWTYLNAEALEDNEQTRQELIAVYKKIWKAIQDNDIDSLKPLFEIRNKDLAEAYYQPIQNTSILTSIKQFSNNDKYKLYTTNKFDGDIMLNIFGNDKLATLSFWDGSSFMAFDNKNKSLGSTSYDLIFAKINGEWKVVL